MQFVPTPGSEVVIRRQRWRVQRVFVHGPIVEIDTGGATFFAPFDRVGTAKRSVRPRRVRPQRARALIAHAIATAESFTLPLAAEFASIDILAHQLEPCLAALSGVRRLLIADDVGLGKTIEAGVIAAELLRRGDACRVLVIAPATLCAQWQDELKRRFNLDATLVTSESLRARTLDLPRETNPWSLDGIYLASSDFIKQPHVFAALPAAPWDLVVIDEAHTIAGDSDRHEAANAIARNARQLVLLTATPHSGDESAARRLAELGSLHDAAADRQVRGGAPDIDELIVFRRMRLDVDTGPLRRIRRVRVALSDAEITTLDVLGRFDRVARAAATDTTRDATELLLAIFNKRALSTFGALLLTIDRRLAFLDGRLEMADANQLSLCFDDDDGASLAARIGLEADRERAWLRRLRALAAPAARVESRVRRLVRLVARTSEAAIVFTEFRDSLAIVERAVLRVATVTVAHGGLTAGLLTEAIAKFHTGEARVLVATDVASQGLNLHQRCRWVIHLDRPWNPVRLEQRAGRVDRLGQMRDVHVTELMTSHDREFELAERVGRRAQAAATSPWLRPCVRWERRARAAARVLRARRALASQWRGPMGIRRPIEISGARVRGGAGAQVRGGTGAPAEALANAGAEVRLLAHGSPGTGEQLWETSIRDDEGRVREVLILGGDASARVAARMKRLARLAAERAAQSAHIERALDARAEQHQLTQMSLPGSHPSTGAPAHSRTRAPEK